MESGGSKTALLVAAYRGRATAHTPQWCSDPWAAALAGPDGLALTTSFDAAFPPSELWVALRTACLDAQVKSLCGPGALTQVVILGAGLDTRAARLAREGVRFFEVDHPDTQRDKLHRLRALPGYPVDAATYVPCDFEKDDFLTRLSAAGFSVDKGALFLWEGVVLYLSEPAVRGTLRRIAEGCHPRTVVVFDYVTPKLVEGGSRAQHDKEQRSQIAGMGEPLRFGIKDPLPLLHDEGFRHVRTVSFDELALSITGTYDRARTFKMQHMALACREVLGSF